MTVKKLYLLSCLLLSGLFINAQSIERSVISSGGKTSELVSYTIGETIISTESTLNISVGFQRAFESEPAPETPLKAKHDISGELKVYPNPSARYVNIQNTTLIDEYTEVSVFDFEGKRLKIPVSIKDHLEIDFNGVIDGTYFLVIKNQVNESIGKFKIVKSK